MEMKVNDKKRVGNVNQTTLTVKNKGSMLTTKQIKKIADKFHSQGFKTIIRGLNIERWTSLKRYEEDTFDDTDFDDYYVNKVKESDVGKFTNFYQAQIIAFK
jgi:hypothetical protein